MAEQHPKPKKSAGGTLLVWQSAVCGVVLLVALIVRLIGGSFYEQLRTTFRNALTDNGIADAVSSWLENGDA
ncbi:MAG: hypothetical protein IJO75_03190 [Clostridia bacterium]|nr:hypothetical protein [Clostridia bacterium]